MSGSVHVRRRLTDLSVHYPWEFKSVGEEFFPRRPTEFLSDQFAVWSKSNLLALNELSPLGDDDTPPDVELKLDADKVFKCKVFGVQSPGKWITEKNADPSLDYETERTIQLTVALRLRLEYLRVKQRLRDTTIMTQNYTLLAGERFDAGTGTPITTMQSIVDQLTYANNGRVPNKIAATRYVWRAVAAHAEFKDLVKYTAIQNAAELSKSESGQIALIEQLIGVKPGTIIVADAVYNAAAADQTPVYTTFMGPDVVFGYVEEWGLRKFSLSAGFQWSAYSNDPQAIIAVPRTINTVVPVEDLRVFCVTDPMIVEPTLGYLLKGAIDATNTTKYGQLVAF